MKTQTNAKQKTGYELKNGDVIYIHGFIMSISSVSIQDDRGQKVVRFNANCTKDKCNDSIRNTSYNGAAYGQLAELTYTIAQ